MKLIPIITESGNQIALQTLFDTGDIEFTRIEIGSGRNQNPEKSVCLNNPVIEGQFLGCDRKDNSAIIKFSFDNRNVSESFNWTEYGIWAKFKTQSDESKEILYCYGCTDEAGDVIPAFVDETTYLKDKFNISIAIGNAQQVSVYLGEYEEYLSKEDFQKHIEDTSNPHSVTKTQIGLENVENIKNDDAVPVFNQDVLNVPAKELSQYAPVQGDNVATLWAKTKRALSDLFNHLKDFKNPHNVTLEQLTGSSSLSELLRKMITEGNQNIVLKNNRFIKGQTTTGSSHNLIGMNNQNEVSVGNDEANMMHIHCGPGGEFCFRWIAGSLYKYFHITNSSSIYCDQIDLASGRQSDSGANLGTSTYRFNTVYAKNALNTSDKKLKENIKPYLLGKALLEKISYKEFNFIGDEEKRVGVIAQEIFKVCQDLGIHNSSIYNASVKDNAVDKHPELENLSDDEIIKYKDSELSWNVDYQQLTNCLIAGFQEYMTETDKRLAKLEKEAYING